MTILEKILQRKIDKINRSMYDDTDFCGRYHIHRIRNIIVIMLLLNLMIKKLHISNKKLIQQKNG